MDIGLDDWSANRGSAGSVTFYVFADQREMFDSGVLTEADDPMAIDLPMTGVRVLELVVTNATGTSLDHASWADAHIHVRGE